MDRIALKAAISEAMKLVGQAHEKVQEAHRIAKADEETGRYIAYDMEDASYNLLRVTSYLGESIDTVDNRL